MYISLSFIYKDRINKKGIIILYLLYFVCLVYLLLFKNFGIRGITFNPFDMIKDIISGNTFVPLMNVLMFIPLGILSKGNKNILRLVVKKSPTGESTHYFFHSQDDKVEVSC